MGVHVIKKNVEKAYFNILLKQRHKIFTLFNRALSCDETTSNVKTLNLNYYKLLEEEMDLMTV